MQSRYNFNNNAKIDKNNNSVLRPILYPEIQILDSDVYIISKDTDRFDTLAFTYYGDVTLWWIIAHANHIKSTMYPSPGTQLRIPMNTQIIFENLKKLNGV